MMSFNRVVGIFSLFISGAAYATDYYVDATLGIDTNPGTESEPWKTISRVHLGPAGNSDDYQPADSILLKRGEVWRESFIVPSSGSPSAPITIGGYGLASSPNPKISCADDISDKLWPGIIANGGFENISTDLGVTSFPGWTSSGSVNSSIASGPGNATPSSAKLILPGGSVSLKTTALHIESSASYTISGSARNLNTGSTLRIYLYNALTGNYKYLDANMNWQVYDPFLTGSGPGTRQPAVSITSTEWTDFSFTFTGIDGTNTFLHAILIGTNAESLVDNVKFTKNGSDFWSIPRGAFVPKILIEDGVRLPFSPEWDETYRWHRVGSASKLNRYTPPTGTVPADHLVEIGARRTGIALFDKHYIVIDGVDVEGCEGPIAGTSPFEGAGILIATGSTNNIVRNLEATNNDNGIRVEGAGPNGEPNADNLFTDFVVSHGINQGIALRNHATRNRINTCTVHDLNMVPSDNDIHGDKEAISVGGSTGNGPGIIVENCTVYNVGTTADGGAGLNIFNSPNAILRYNTIDNIGRLGIGVGANNRSPNGWLVDNIKIYGNLITRTGISPATNAGQGIGVSASDYGDINGVEIYNNTIVGCELHDNKDGGISIRGVKNPDGTLNSVDNIQIRNNIVSGCFGTYPRAIFIGDTRIVEILGVNLDNNLYHPDISVTPSQSFVYFNDNNYTLDTYANYPVTENQDLNSLQANPLFVDQANMDFHLDALSPAVNSGAAVGITHDIEGMLIAGAPDMGAYEYQPDTDGDGWVDTLDNCPMQANADQLDTDGDGMGDACDSDRDGDGYDNMVDCLPDDPNAYPGAAETKHDGIDQDCNGYDLTIEIIMADYLTSNQKLRVWATSDLNGGAALVVDGFGAMDWKSSESQWRKVIRNVSSAPSTVMVSGIEGLTTVSVTIR